MTGVLTKCDAVVQRWFDKRFTWLMERGVPKRVIRWNLYLVFVLAFIAAHLPWFSAGGYWKPVFGTFLIGLYVLVYGTAMQRDHDADEEVERRGLFRSRADAGWAASSMKTLGFLLLFLGTVPYALAWVLERPWIRELTAGQVFEAVWQLVHGFSAVALGYLCGTPPARPKPRQERTAAVHAVGAHS